MWQDRSGEKQSALRLLLKTSIVLVLLLLVGSANGVHYVSAAPTVGIPAFPGAEGWGAQSVGGRGGRVIEVTNLNDAGEGSLRACAEASGPRTCVFRVGGTIHLDDAIRIKRPYITIAGQTAPGDGITYIGGDLRVSTHDVIIRYVSYRGGSSSGIKIRPWNDAHDIIIDHCSVSGGKDDTIDVWWNVRGPNIRMVTIQKCIIAEAIKGHPTAMMFGGSPEDGASDLIDHISAHSNYLVHNGWRNPHVKSKHTEVINNVVYNWGHRIGVAAGDGAEADWTNNYFRTGPMSGSLALLFEYLDSECNPYPPSSLYVAGNIMPSKDLTDPSQDNWYLLKTNHASCDDRYNPVPTKHRRFTPLTPAPIPVTIKPASLSLADALLEDVGANKRLNGDGTFTVNRDSADQKFIDDFYAGTGPSSPPESPTVPTIKSGAPYADTDHDGMADEWEFIHGFNPDIEDGSEDADGDGYTNLEEFLNGTSPSKEMTAAENPT